MGKPGPCIPWTNLEINKMIEMHRERYPTLQELYVAVPRHTMNSIHTRATILGLRRTPAAQRLIRAHLYFERREAEQKS